MTRVAAVALDCGILTHGFPLFILAGMAGAVCGRRMENAAVGEAILVRAADGPSPESPWKSFGDAAGRLPAFRWWRGPEAAVDDSGLAGDPVAHRVVADGKKQGEPASNSAAEIALSAAEPSAEANRESSGGAARRCRPERRLEMGPSGLPAATDGTGDPGGLLFNNRSSVGPPRPAHGKRGDNAGGAAMRLPMVPNASESKPPAILNLCFHCSPFGRLPRVRQAADGVSRAELVEALAMKTVRLHCTRRCRGYC